MNKNNKLTIEYDNKQKEVNNSQLQKLEKYCQKYNQKEITRQKLGIDSNHSTNNSQSNPNKNNHQLAIGLALGASAVIIGIIVVYFIRKTKKK